MCQSTALTFTSPPSTVLIFTDRGGSSFDTPTAVGALPTTGSFFNVRAAVEDAIGGVQGQYRFGLGVFIGDHSTSTCQLGYTSAPIALNNAAAISAVYDALGPSPYKADTPTTAALAMAKAALLADTGAGSKFLLFITNGATDYCDDGFPDCPTDSVAAQLQAIYAGSPGIETLVIGLSTTSTGLTPGALPTFANAGAGQPAAFAGSSGETQSDLYYECDGISAWHALFATSGKTAPAPLGTYAATGGTAPLYKATTNATADVETQVKAALAAMKSCSFQLTAHSINPAKVTEGTVTVGGTNYAEDAANGWSMPSSTVVTLNGAACSSYRQTGAAVAINFPCDAIAP